MSARNKVWFEEAGRKLDPGLIEQLHLHRQNDPSETSNTTIPVIVRFSSKTKQDKKIEILSTCTNDDDNILENPQETEEMANGYLTPEKIKQLKDDENVDRIFYDREVTTLLDIATKQIGAAEVKEQLGFTGKDVTIAVIDTGIYPHADLTKPDNRIIAFKDFVNNKQDPYDDNGHGTHCAGDAVSNGHLSNGKYAGPAPNASLIGVKALDQKGSGKLSTIIKGIEWCINHKDDYNIRIISLSLGGKAYESYRDDPLAQAAQKAWHHGIVVCAAAGNSGPKPMTISTPAINPFILTVGSTTDQNTAPRSDDKIADYSSRGPTIDKLIKPDIYAPGTDIISLSAPGSQLEKQLPEQIIDQHYLQISGTSMATPICAGVVALMLEANPTLSPNDVKSILQTTAQPMLNDLWGYIEAKSAVEMAKSYLEFRQGVAAAK